MKKITSLLFLAVAGINFSSAQTPVLFGTCSQGGTLNGGTIFQADLDGSNLHTVYSFQNVEGALPWGKIAQASNGKIYGVTFLGGCSDSCVIYEYDPIAGTCTDVYDFFCNGPPVSEPSPNGLILSHDGNLYGLGQSGLLYKFNPNTHVYTLLNQSSASYSGGLLQVPNGTLYGVSYSNGVNNQGYIFSYDLTTQVYFVLYSFDGIHGANPYYENLILGTGGKLYGTTIHGGANNMGVIFSYDLSSNIYTDLHDFDATSGSFPYSGLIQVSNGKLYGMTHDGGTSNYGVIFSYDIPTAQYTVRYNFDGNNGANPERGLTQVTNGKLFGTAGGGSSNGGVAFSFDITTNAYIVVAYFDLATGSGPLCDIQQGVLPIVEGIASADNSPASIYVDPVNQLVVRSQGFGDRREIVVYDGQGKNVFQSQVQNQESKFDLSSYQRGVYFVQLKTNAKIVTQKIILSK